MRYSLITQVTLITLSIVIFLTVIKPLFASISVVQDERLVYADAVEKAQQFNDKLDELIATRNSFREEDLQKLETFLPSEIDTLQVMRDIEAIFDSVDFELMAISLGETSGESNAEVYINEFGQEQVGGGQSLAYQDVSVNFVGTYEDLKLILDVIERNQILLEITNLSFGTVPTTVNQDVNSTNSVASPDEAEFTFDISFRVYGLKTAAVVNVE